MITLLSDSVAVSQYYIQQQILWEILYTYIKNLHDSKGNCLCLFALVQSNGVMTTKPIIRKMESGSHCPKNSHNVHSHFVNSQKVGSIARRSGANSSLDIDYSQKTCQRWVFLFYQVPLINTASVGIR